MLAAGTPVLVTPVGGLPEAVSGLSPNLVLPGSDTDSLRQGLIASLTGTLQLPSAEACQAYVREHYDWPIIAPQIRAVYEEALR